MYQGITWITCAPYIRSSGQRETLIDSEIPRIRPLRALEPRSDTYTLKSRCFRWRRLYTWNNLSCTPSRPVLGTGMNTPGIVISGDRMPGGHRLATHVRFRVVHPSQGCIITTAVVSVAHVIHVSYTLALWFKCTSSSGAPRLLPLHSKAYTISRCACCCCCCRALLRLGKESPGTTTLPLRASLNSIPPLAFGTSYFFKRLFDAFVVGICIPAH